MALIFSVSDLRQETAALRGIARAFLEPGADSVLREAESELSNLAARSSDHSYDWAIRPTNPLRTRCSRGAYMPGDRGSLHLHGEISFIWQLQPVRDGGDSRPAKKVRLTGRASTLIRLLHGEAYSGEPDEELAVWRMEIADDLSPGAYFHVQVLGRKTDKVMFPHALDVPRLPSSLISPFACSEFVIAELFQMAWDAHANHDFRDMRQWRKVQANRHLSQLEWHINQVKAAAGSPWAAWKTAKPPEDLFLK